MSKNPLIACNQNPKLIFPLNFRNALFSDVVIVQHATRIETLHSQISFTHIQFAKKNVAMTIKYF